MEVTGFATIEAERAGRAISVAALCAAADCSERHYYRYRAGAPMPAGRAAAFRRALSRLSGTPGDMAAGGREVFLAYWPIAVLAANAMGVSVETLRANPHGQRATMNAEWQAAATVRRVAVYLANTTGNIRQSALARALGMTPAAICQIVARMEDERDADPLRGVVDRLERELAP